MWVVINQPDGMPKLFFLKEAVLIQRLGWPLYFLVTVILNYKLNPERTLLEQLIALGLMFVVFNACVWILYLIFDMKRKWLAWVGLILVFLFTSELVYYVVYQLMPNYGIIIFKENLVKKDSMFHWEMLNRYLTVILLAAVMVLHIRSKMNLMAKHKEEAARHAKEIEARDSQLAMLGAQNDPHFVFNILADVRDRCQELLPNEARTIDLLSDMWRYSQLSIDKPIVVIEKEIDAVQRYLELECTRYESCYATFRVEGEACGQKLPPGILRTCLENAFKYGYRGLVDKPIEATLWLMDDGFRFVCKNWIKPNREDIPSTGLGLNNTRRRLELLFPDTHEMTVCETAQDIFTVEITILENEEDFGDIEMRGAR